jgi:hypothetical protein
MAFFEMPKMHKDTQPFLLGALAGALLISWIGFDLLGWKLSGKAEAQAKKQTEIAVTAAYANICNAHFRAAAKFPARLADLEKTDRWSRGDAIVKAGYATMPGVKEPSRDVGQACADLLIPDKVVSQK